MSQYNQFLYVQRAHFDFLWEHCRACPNIDRKGQELLQAIARSPLNHCEPKRKSSLLSQADGHSKRRREDLARPVAAARPLDTDLPIATDGQTNTLLELAPVVERLSTGLHIEPERRAPPELAQVVERPRDAIHLIAIDGQTNTPPELARLSTGLNVEAERQGVSPPELVPVVERPLDSIHLIGTKDSSHPYQAAEGSNKWLKRVSDAKIWRQSQRKIVMTTSEYKRMIRCFTQNIGTNFDKCNTQHPNGEAGLIAIGIRLAQLASNTFEMKTQISALANFQFLLLISYCAFLREMKMSQDDIERILNSCTRGIDGKRRARYIDRAVFINTCIGTVTSAGGWSIPRATELFLICSLGHIQIVDVSIGTIRDLFTQLPSMKFDFSGCMIPSYTIPGLIKCMLCAADSDANISVEEISRSLGYPKGKIPQSIESLYQVESTDCTISYKFQTVVGAEPHRERSSTTQLLNLLRFICTRSEGISRNLLTHAGSLRSRWLPSGNIEYYGAEALGAQHEIVKLCRNTESLGEDLYLLERADLITQREGDIKLSCAKVCEIEGPGWEQAIAFVCFYFSGCEYSKGFTQIGNAALPLFRRLITQIDKSNTMNRPALRVIAIDAILQASKFSTPDWKSTCVNMVESLGLEHSDAYSKATFSLRKGFVLRSAGRWEESVRVTQQCLSTFCNTDQKSNAIRGLLVTSLASSLWEIGDFSEAFLTWETWAPLETSDSMSLYETRVFIRKCASFGVACLHSGRYETAKLSLEHARNTYDDKSRPRLDVLASLSDVYCEMNDPNTALRYLEPVVQDPHRLQDRYYRNCWISYAEASVCAARHEQAEKMLLALKDQFTRSEYQGRPDRRRHLRVLVLLAQNSHRQANTRTQWAETRQRWGHVISYAENFDEISAWDLSLIYFSTHHVDVELGKNHDYFKMGVNKYSGSGQSWMRGMTTYWYRFICSRLPQVAEVLALQAAGSSLEVTKHRQCN